MTTDPASQSLHTLHSKRLAVPGLILASLGVFLVGIFVPVLEVGEILASDSIYSVVGGVIQLADDGRYGLSAVVVLFSVLFPLWKLLTLLGIWFRRFTDRRRARVLFWLKILGKWSMLDVFVAVITVGAVQLGILAQARLMPGIHVFTTGILLSMVVTFVVDRVARRESGG